MRFVIPALCVFVPGFCLMSCAPALSSVKVPVLRSEYFERNWGKPDVEIRPDGGYSLRYRQGTTLNFVMIHGLTSMQPPPTSPPDWVEASEDPEGTRPAPAVHRQSWGRVDILNVPVKWYQADGGSGADFPCYKTVDFALTAPNDRAGFYRIEICAETAPLAACWFERVNW